MENKINIAELLKDCPKGMELDCTMYDNLYFDSVNADYYGTINCYTLIDGIKTSINFTKYGTFNNYTGAKCVIFPKGKTTWDGFVPPCKFKDGDILATDLGSVFFLNTCLNTDEYYGCYVGVGLGSSFYICVPFAYKECCGLATEEEKQKLFDAIKANGYKWNAETKTLEELIKPKFKVGDTISYEGIVATITDMGKEFYTCTNGCIDFKYQDNWVLVKDNIKPKFKVGDRIKQKGSPRCYIISSIEFDRYRLNNNQFIRFVDEKIYELVPNKFDITTLKPFESRVLVRDYDYQYWRVSFFGYFDKFMGKFDTVRGVYIQCIPYEGNEHLLGTTNDCDEYYKNW